MSVDQTKLNAVLANLPGDAAKIVAAIQAVRGIANVNATSLAAAEASVSALQTQSTSHGSRLTTVESTISDYADVKADLQAAGIDIGDLQARVTTIETALGGDIQDTLDALAAADVLFAQEDQSLAASLAQAQSDILSKHAEQQTAIEAAAGDASSALTAATAANAAATSASADAASAAADVAALTASLATANTKITEITNALNSLLTALAGEADAVDVI